MLKLFCKWLKDESATAVVEASMVFPIMLTMLFGTIDIGRGLLINKKLISATQIVSDLLARGAVVNNDMIDDAIIAAELAIQPFQVDDFGIDIVGIHYNEDDGTPEEGWRETRGMLPNDTVFAQSVGLGDPDEGVLAITIQFTYRPTFSGIIVEDFVMQEVAFVRGRRTPYVERI